MSKAMIIEAQGDTAGIIVGSTGSFAFVSQVSFDARDGRTFRSVEQANRAAAAHLATQTQHKAA